MQRAIRWPCGFGRSKHQVADVRTDMEDMVYHHLTG